MTADKTFGKRPAAFALTRCTFVHTHVLRIGRWRRQHACRMTKRGGRRSQQIGPAWWQQAQTLRQSPALRHLLRSCRDPEANAPLRRHSSTTACRQPCRPETRPRCPVAHRSLETESRAGQPRCCRGECVPAQLDAAGANVRCIRLLPHHKLNLANSRIRLTTTSVRVARRVRWQPLTAVSAHRRTSRERCECIAHDIIDIPTKEQRFVPSPQCSAINATL